jgi:DNA-binding CsgD family transcriptional regulator
LHWSFAGRTIEGVRSAADDLVGRDEELAAIRVALGAGSGPVVVLEGDAGIGKTALWRASLAEARRRSMRVLLCRPTAAEAQLSFAGLGDLLEPVLPEGLSELPDPQRSALEVALLLRAADGSRVDRRAIGLAVLGILRALAADRPLAVAVDDAHWLDEPSAAALAFAVRRLGEVPAAVIVAQRPRPADADLAVAGGERTTRVRLGPLTTGALHRVVRLRAGLRLTRPALARLHALSGGNPFYALEIARALGERGEVRVEELPMPDDVEKLVRSRLAVLPARVRDDLFLVSVLANPSTTIVESASRRPDLAFENLRVAAGAGIVELRGGRVLFTHPILAAALQAEIGPSRQRELHRALAGRVSDPEERARHLALGAEGPDEEIATALDDAARLAAARGAPGAAAELAVLAVSLTPGDAGRRGLAAARYAFAGGDMGSARATLEQLVSGLPYGEERAEALLLLARAREDDLEVACGLFEQALEDADGDAMREAQIHRFLGEAWLVRGNLNRALEHGHLAVSRAEEAGDSALLAGAIAFASHFETLAARVTPGLLERGVELERSGADSGHYYRPSVVLGLRHLYADRLDEARSLLESALRAATDDGDDYTRAGLLMHLSHLECRAGELARAEAHAEEGLMVAEQFGTAETESALLQCRALVAAHRGRAGVARSAAERSIALSASASAEVFRRHAEGTLGFLELSLGEPTAAASRLRPLVDEYALSGYGLPSVNPILPDAIEALLAIGESDEARLLLGRLEERGRTLDQPWARSTAARCRGLLLAAEGDLDGAVDALRHAVELHARSPQPLERARTLLALGTALRRARCKRAARETIGEALRVFEALGADLWAARAREELGRIGGRARARGLTPTEARVSALVAAGKSNKEVAAALFLAVHTVETNLSRIYEKLGIRSRTELARRLADEQTEEVSRISA